jgi:hypothetical protein
VQGLDQPPHGTAILFVGFPSRGQEFTIGKNENGNSWITKSHKKCWKCFSIKLRILQMLATICQVQRTIYGTLANNVADNNLWKFGYLLLLNRMVPVPWNIWKFLNVF